ncbi:MAG TPA: carboxypeptidase-like regulatory domain-containing protein [Mucilaginibacter sp.]|nr:carboxypeptidase-like regulatory domain-containing protein [Mucilaginibacter sp.]
MTKVKCFCIFVFLLVARCYGQIKITGQVIDAQNKPIPLATISLIGINTDATTDDSGVFFLILPNNIKKGDPITLRVSKAGYKITTKHTPASYLSISIKLIKNLNLISKTSLADKLNDNPKSVTSNQVENQPTNVTSYFQSGGITAGQVIIAPPNRKLDENNSAQLLNSLPDKNEKINVTSVWGDSEAFGFATVISDFLKSKGYKKIDGVDQSMFTRPVVGQIIQRDSTGVKIIIGARQ